MSGLILAPSCMVEDVIPERNIPTLTASGASDISRNSAVINGSISGKDLSMVKSFGFKFGPDEKMSQTIAISGTPGTMKYEVTGLEAGKAYYYTVFLTNGISTLTGTTKVFTTISVLAATVANLKVEKSGAVFNASAEITDDGGSDIKSVGFCYGLEPEPSTQNAGCKTITTKTDESGSFFSAVIEEFEPGKTYYVRAFVDCDLNGNGSSTYSYSEQLTFVSDAVAPLVTTNEVADADVLSETATVYASVTSDGGSEVTERGFVWSKKTGPTLENAESIKSGSGAGNFSATLTDLSIDTEYYLRAYAINAIGLTYGEEVTFKTKAGRPEVTLIAVGDVTNVSAKVSASVTDQGTAEVTERGAVWSTAANPTIANSKKIASEAGAGSYSVTISENLAFGSTYYVRAYAINKNGVSYSNEEMTFQLRTDVALVTTGNPTNVTSNSADCSGNVENDYGIAVTERGFVWSSTNKSPNLDDGERKSCGSGTGEFSRTINDLMPNTLYYVNTYAISEAGTAYGSVKTFTTLSQAPIVATVVNMEEISEDSAVVGGSIESDGGSAVTERGVLWGTSPNPQQSGRKVSVDINRDDYTTRLTNLERFTTYYVQAYAKNENGISYGNEMTFKTKMDRPAVTTASVSDVTAGSAKCGGNVTSAGGGSILERGVVLSKKESPTVNDIKIVCGEGLGAFSTEVTGLDASSVYYVRAYTVNEDWTVYGEQVSFMTDSIGNAEDWPDSEYNW